MSESVVVPGGRDVRGTLDAPTADACVVACPPHPQMGGKRTDRRLQAVSDALAPDVSTLRFDYGAWDEGYGEVVDARNALRWARDRFDTVGLFGYSFGGCIAILAAATESDEDAPPAVVAVLAPVSRLADDLDAAARLDAVRAPGYVCYGERDTTADWESVVGRARDCDWTVESLRTDHHFVGRTAAVGESCGGFLQSALDDPS